MHKVVILLSILLGIACVAPAADPFLARRQAMVEHDIKGRGIRDRRLLEAMQKVPRHLFVGESQRWQAYADHPLPIGEGQTISQPYVVALMTEALQLRPSDRVRGDRHRLRLPGGGAGGSGAGGVHHRDPQAPCRIGGEEIARTWLSESAREIRGWLFWLEGRGAVRRDHCHRRGQPYFPPSSSSS